MNSIEHPESEQLAAYLANPDLAEQQATGLHLASCTQCRSDLQALASLRQHAPWIASGSNGSPDLISDLIHNRLSDEAAVELRSNIKNDPKRLREALHYARHHVAMQKDVEAPQISVNEGSFWDTSKRLLARLLQVETPVWKLAPVAAVLIAGVMLFNGVQNQENTMQVAHIIRFQDQPTIQFVSHEIQPGIGFFANSKQTNKPFGGLSLHMGDRPRSCIFLACNRRRYSLPVKVAGISRWRDSRARTCYQYRTSRDYTIARAFNPASL